MTIESHGMHQDRGGLIVRLSEMSGLTIVFFGLCSIALQQRIATVTNLFLRYHRIVCCAAPQPQAAIILRLQKFG